MQPVRDPGARPIGAIVDDVKMVILRMTMMTEEAMTLEQTTIEGRRGRDLPVTLPETISSSVAGTGGGSLTRSRPARSPGRPRTT